MSVYQESLQYTVEQGVSVEEVNEYLKKKIQGIEIKKIEVQNVVLEQQSIEERTYRLTFFVVASTLSLPLNLSGCECMVLELSESEVDKEWQQELPPAFNIAQMFFSHFKLARPILPHAWGTHTKKESLPAM